MMKNGPTTFSNVNIKCGAGTGDSAIAFGRLLFEKNLNGKGSIDEALASSLASLESYVSALAKCGAGTGGSTIALGRFFLQRYLSEKLTLEEAIQRALCALQTFAQSVVSAGGGQSGMAFGIQIAFVDHQHNFNVLIRLLD